MIVLAATLYGIGKTFFWPTTLGVVAEQFPRGGALTLNAMGGMGMLGVGVIGAMLMGNVQDRAVDVTLKSTDAAVHQQIMVQKTSLLGRYQAIDETKLQAADETAKAAVKNAQDGSKKVALKYVAVLPALMFLCYLGLIVYFKRKGGYKPVEITEGAK